MALLLATLAAVYALDRVSKVLAFRRFPVDGSRRSGAILAIRPVKTPRPWPWRNVSHGALLAAYGIALICALLYEHFAAPPGSVLRIGLGAALGGALGNMVDRLRHGAVLDFLKVGALGIENTFNPADVALVLGIGAVLVSHARAVVSLLG